MKKLIGCFAFILILSSAAYAQCTLVDGEYVNAAGGDCQNIILTAVPFLRITPDARTASLGDAGIAISPDANSIAFNGSKLAWAEEDYQFSATYTPWLRELGVTDVYLAHLSGYLNIDELQTVGASLRFFNLGEVQFTDINGMSLGMGNPIEFEFAVAYARKLSEKLSAGLTGKFIYSNLASGQSIGNQEIIAATSGAVDLSATYQTAVGAAGNDLTIGLAITNLGSKVTYVRDLTSDFIPTNLGIGAAYTSQLDDYNKLTFALDINKLLVPTSQFPTLGTDPQTGEDIENPEYDKDQNGIADFREQSLFSGVLGSFSDAPNGFEEELQEIYYSFGMEYWYNNVLAIRAGYFLEHQNKGNRQYITAGAGIQYENLGLNISYLIPTTNQRSALDNTLRFSLIFTAPDSGNDTGRR